VRRSTQLPWLGLTVALLAMLLCCRLAQWALTPEDWWPTEVVHGIRSNAFIFMSVFSIVGAICGFGMGTRGAVRCSGPWRAFWTSVSITLGVTVGMLLFSLFWWFLSLGDPRGA
jgi:hypothetical protein